MEWLTNPEIWVAFLTLTALEIVLGIDNIIMIAILVSRMPPHMQARTRFFGLALAMVTRILLLLSITWIMRLTTDLFHVFGQGISGRDLILFFGGLFLLWKSSTEIYHGMEGEEESPEQPSGAGKQFLGTIIQIAIIDIVFSLDSVITAVGMVRELSIMVIAVVIAIGVMMLASKPLMAFVSRHPTVVILCLGFLLMIGFSLIVEGLGFHIPKGYLYAAIGFSILIEAANQIGRRNVRKRVTTADLRDRTSKAVLRILRGGKAEPEASEEVAALVSSGAGEMVFSPAESSMIERVLTLGGRTVRSIMVPRVDAVWLDADDPPQVILDEIHQSGRSRFPVCRGEVDAVLGIVHAKDLLEQQRQSGRIDLTAALREPLYIPENLPVLKALERFKTSTVHLAIVLDEHGSVEGLVTPTDILAAIAGDLPELAADALPDAVKAGERSWLLDGRMPIDAVERTLGASGMANDEYATLAGFVLAQLGRIPKAGEAFDWQGWRFQVVELEGHRIDKVQAVPTEVAIL